MNKHNIELWITALRSGKYNQTTGCLHNENGYCCLGVACDVAIKNGEKIRVTRNKGSGETEYDNNNEILPARVQDWLGIDRSNPRLKYNGSYQAASILNDYRGLDFNQFADAIVETFLNEEEL